mmetsp:Transcript_18872/g.39979  ORF Transcript_18872/g.39979 Transcript_18872/m.39979 type:complete len:234 (+) Transcript_18872:1722-2423(+)
MASSRTSRHCSRISAMHSVTRRSSLSCRSWSTSRGAHGAWCSRQIRKTTLDVPCSTRGAALLVRRLLVSLSSSRVLLSMTNMQPASKTPSFVCCSHIGSSSLPPGRSRRTLPPSSIAEGRYTVSFLIARRRSGFFIISLSWSWSKHRSRWRDFPSPQWISWRCSRISSNSAHRTIASGDCGSGCKDSSMIFSCTVVHSSSSSRSPVTSLYTSHVFFISLSSFILLSQSSWPKT